MAEPATKDRPDVTVPDHPDVAPATPDRDPGPQRSAVEAAAKDEEITSVEAMDATDWFLNPDPDEDVSTKTFRLRVGKPGSKREWVRWTVQAMPRERIQQIREQERKPQSGRDARRGVAETDDARANLRVATEGTLSPDFTDERIRGQFADPADAMRDRFKFKPGLIDQIAGMVMEVSGYDDADVDEVKAVKGS